MTTTLREAAEMALEALESYAKSDYIKQHHPKRRAAGDKAIAALRAALAEQPAPIAKPSARVKRGMTMIRAEMGVVADIKSDEGKDGRRDADAIRAALEYIAALAARPGGQA